MGGETNSTITGLTAGDYTVTVTDGNSCAITSATLTITEPANALSIANVPTHVALCYGDNSGAIAITASGGTGA